MLQKWIFTCRIIKEFLYFSSCIKINFNWIKDLNVIHHSLKLSKGTCQEYQHGLGPSENDSNSSGNKTKNSQIGMHEIEKLPHSKEKNSERKAYRMGENLC